MADYLMFPRPPGPNPINNGPGGDNLFIVAYILIAFVAVFQLIYIIYVKSFYNSFRRTLLQKEN